MGKDDQQAGGKSQMAALGFKENRTGHRGK